ncbi:hypothetical protein QWZ03_17190 [Chitinimonas viridis]|uniref:Outer membrane protein beta-barrel domain-containing protein n=1 Tax=Chitinimonas viridis TaxID=664880 RepID=A0ABT8B8Q7_9NEIS|nr:hypothetical protein [Chitinimonas viridis]MDN3578508.1 hypothetical protein [Chitinimonas viridis]
MRRPFMRLAVQGLLISAAVGATAEVSVPHKALRFTMTAGLTAGGDKIDQIQFDNGHDQSIRAGGNVNMGAGITWQPQNSPFSAQLTGNYQVAGVFAKNGSATFNRFPVELIGFYNINDKFRVGLGLRRVFNPNYSYDVGSGYDLNFKDATGAVIEAGYFFTPSIGLNLRYVKEEYELENSRNNLKVDGSHVGINSTFMF